MDVDEHVAAAVRAVHDELMESGEEVDWDGFKTALAARAEAEGIAAELVDQLIEEMNNDPTPLETIATLGLEGDPGDGANEEAWHPFLTEHGPRWDGEESSWDEFKQWFLYEADQKSVAIPANQFVIYVESQNDKIATFAQYGVAVAQPAKESDSTAETPAAVDTSTFPDLREGDSGDWVQYLDEMLKSKGF